MKFIFDDNLPVALARWIASQGHSANHLRDVSLSGALDPSIWSFAERSGSIIVTKDRNFMVRRAAVATGLTVVWLRFGNTRKAALIAKMPSIWPEIISRLAQDQALLEIYD